MEKQGVLNLNVSTSIKSSQTPTQVKFSTLDKNTARLIFNVKQEGIEMPLANAVSGKLDMIMADGSRFEDITVEIIDGEKGILGYTLTPEQIKHAGHVEGELFAVYETGTMSISQFDFRIDKALRDQDREAVTEYFVNGFDEMKKRVSDKANEVIDDIDEIDTRITTIENKVNSFQANVGQTTVVQVNDALKNSKNKTYANLKARLDFLEDGDIDLGTF